LLMIAADVDNDIFDLCTTTGDGDGEGIGNLAYRITAFYTGLDPVLAVSAGLKHFLKRRLGRSGLDRTLGNGHTPTPDNVWDTDCTEFFGGIPASEIHGAYFAKDRDKVWETNGAGLTEHRPRDPGENRRSVPKLVMGEQDIVTPSGHRRPGGARSSEIFIARERTLTIAACPVMPLLTELIADDLPEATKISLLRSYHPSQTLVPFAVPFVAL
jgi:hypothetical protein